MKSTPQLATPPYPAIRCHSDLEVRYAETDQMGVVHHANYLVWFELARTQLCATSGISYAEIERRGYWLMVTGAHLSYRGGARYGDTVRITCQISRESSRLQWFDYEVTVLANSAGEPGAVDARIGQTVVTGRTEHVWVSATTRKSARLPEELHVLFRRIAGKEPSPPRATGLPTP